MFRSYFITLAHKAVPVRCLCVKAHIPKVWGDDLRIVRLLDGFNPALSFTYTIYGFIVE